MHITTRHRRELGFAALFLLLFGAMQFGYSLCRDTVVEHVIIDVLTVKPSAYLINTINPAEQALAKGHSLISPWARLNVLNGCEGIESIFLVLAALFAYALPMSAKLKGAFYATVLLYSLNQLRITALFFSFRYDRELFSLLHGYIGPTAIIAVGILFFLWWVSRYRLATI